jgi:hypothetical protein
MLQKFIAQSRQDNFSSIDTVDLIHIEYDCPIRRLGVGGIEFGRGKD